MRMLRAAMAENFGDVEVTRENVDIAAQEFTALGDRWGLATVVAMKAQLQTYDGDLEGAMASYAEAEEYLRALGAHSDEAFMAMRLANLRLRLDDLDGARREIARFSELDDPGGFGQILANAGRGMMAVREGDMTTVAEVRDTMLGHSESSRTLGGAHGLALLGTMVALLDVELGDLDAASKSVTAGYTAALATKDMPILAGNGAATARLALAYDRCEVAAELLGAAARVRGIEDATDPTIAELFAVLPTRLGEEAFAAAYDRGWSLSQADAVKRLDPASLDVTEAEPLEADEVGGVEAPAQARRR
jgi:ATP/maltotriose-dependent transcriptional regulator MalT